MYPIDLSDDSSAVDVIDLSAESDDVIEICEIDDYKNDTQYDDIFKESELLGEFIEKCLELENTKGMVRVINQILIPAYYSTTKTFRESDMFKTLMSRTICKLDSDPDHKFSHVNDLCNGMKIKSKKLHQTLLNKNKYLKKIKRKNQVTLPPRKKRKPNKIENIIVSDDSNGFEVPIINLEEYVSQATSEEDCPIFNTGCEENLHNNKNIQDTFENEIKDSESTKYSTEVNIINKKDELSVTNNVSAELQLQNENLKIETQSNKNAVGYDTEVSSSEISSTVYIDDNSDENVKGSQDSELIIIDEDEKELVTTTQGVSDVKYNVNLVHSKENLSTVPVKIDYKYRESIKSFEDKDLIMLDEDDNTKQILTQEVMKENVRENPNINSNENSSKRNVNIVPTLNDAKKGESIHDSAVNNLIILDKENELDTTTQNVNQDRTKRLNVNTHSVENKNYSSKNKELVKNNNCIVIDDEDNSENNACNNNSVNIIYSSPINEENKLLVPHKAEVFKETAEDILMMKIRKLEFEIAACKAKINELEEEEVTNDFMWSPYIECEKYKAKIVKLYKDLCKLTGEQAVKRREVRLKAANMRSQLCVDKLEELINSNIGHDGLPHFPDFQDVLECVREANREGELGWNRNDVMREANALFTYCGRALQESRKRREWRDMMSLVKSEVMEDPADNDPVLMARLQANRQIALKREKDLLDRYSEISYLPNTEGSKENDVAYDSVSEDETGNGDQQEITSTQDPARVTSQLTHNTTVTNQCTPTKLKELQLISQNLIKAVFNNPTVNVNDRTKIHNVDDILKTTIGSQVIKKRCTPIKLEDKIDSRSFMNSRKTLEVSSNIDPKNILNHNFNLVTKVVLHKIDLSKPDNAKSPFITDSYSIKKENDSESDNTHLVNEVKKELYVDIQEQLDNLGNDFTATVIDIEDPFLIVEISSDSEDEDDVIRNGRFLL